jgi:hypothetical protein
MIDGLAKGVAPAAVGCTAGKGTIAGAYGGTGGLAAKGGTDTAVGSGVRNGSKGVIGRLAGGPPGNAGASWAVFRVWVGSALGVAIGGGASAGDAGTVRAGALPLRGPVFADVDGRSKIVGAVGQGKPAMR